MHLVGNVVLMLCLLVATPTSAFRSLLSSSLRRRTIGWTSAATARTSLRQQSSCLAATSNGNIHGVTRNILSERVRSALIEAFGEDGKEADTMLVPAKPEFGDFQCNAALPLAKKMKEKPRDLAEKLMATLSKDVHDVVATMDISGPGFINLHLSDSYLKSKLTAMLRDPQRLAISPVTLKQRVIVDFSSPNIAKEMHVGHLRSTIIGDSLSRVLEFLGHDVLRLNHVGDWGTQFGMLIRFMQEKYPDITSTTTTTTNDGQSTAVLGGAELGDLVEFYRAAKKRFDEDKDFEAAARAEVVKLQGGDEGSLKAWRAICDLSRVEFQKIYDMLQVQVEERGESFYNPMLPSIVQDLETQGVAVQSEGATCVFVPGYMNPDGTPQPLIVRKSDGGFLYATTDLAAIRHRAKEEQADRVLYVTDVGQAQHFEMVFKAANSAGLLDPTKTELKHVPFGLVQGEDGKKFKTRSGDTVKLKDLLDEAIRIAEEDFSSRLQRSVEEMTVEEKEVARVVGLSAVKYADLSMNRESNYRFSYKKMLSLSGNTAPYMLYAYARIQGIRRKALDAIGGASDGSAAASANAGVVVDLSSSLTTAPFTPEEKMLAKQLLRLDEVLEEVARDLYPNKLCEYLFELSQRFNQFYEKCPVLKAETLELQQSRTALCSLTADALKLSLGLLGINTVEKL